MSFDLRSTHRTVLVNEYEAFWLDCIRVACNDAVPEPTLARAQALRRLFTTDVQLVIEEAEDGRRP